jgi:hypothetical protein
VRGKGEQDEEVKQVEVKIVEVKCSQCKKDTQSPPAQQCHSCAAHVCTTCTPRIDIKECPVCDCTFREVDVVVPAPAPERVE